MECGAQKRGGKGICKARAMENGRCRIHGGKSPSGIASPHFTTGRYSKHMPTRMAAKYEESLKDVDILSLRHEIALLDSQMADVLESANNSEAGELWKRLKEAMREYDAAAGKKDPDSARADAFGRMRWIVNEGYQDWMARIEARNIIQSRVATVSSERQRVEKLMEFAESAMAASILGALYHCVEKHVTDRDTLTAIGRELRFITARQAGG
jgi:hypothetical protein